MAMRRRCGALFVENFTSKSTALALVRSFTRSLPAFSLSLHLSLSRLLSLVRCEPQKFATRRTVGRENEKDGRDELRIVWQEEERRKARFPSCMTNKNLLVFFFSDFLFTYGERE